MYRYILQQYNINNINIADFTLEDNKVSSSYLSWKTRELAPFREKDYEDLDTQGITEEDIKKIQQIGQTISKYLDQYPKEVRMDRLNDIVLMYELGTMSFDETQMSLPKISI